MTMELIQCSCRYAAEDAGFAEHLGEVFIPADDIGTDGQAHAEMSPDHVRAASGRRGARSLPGFTCLCGFFTEELAAFDDHLLAMFITADHVGTDGIRHAEAGTVEPLVLCPGCCAVDDIPEWTPTAQVLTPLVACSRCPFMFPVLPGEFRQLTLDVMHNHECNGIHQGNWPDLGQAIVDAIHEQGISTEEFAARLQAAWPAGRVYSQDAQAS
jgi:hypothetical protein